MKKFDIRVFYFRFRPRNRWELPSAGLLRSE